ncbi:MAG: hypothetical protein IJ204_01005 [Paludibacteraceae bacterium]|nr:hypothetical protein [Paludibacteraceae bacterium]
MEQREKNVPTEGREMNFFDLCVACGRAIGNGCKALWRLFCRMLKLSYRYWWIVLTTIVLAIAAALYYSRWENLTYKVNAVALLNGPTISQFEQAYMPLCSGLIDPSQSVRTYVSSRQAFQFATFRVIDTKEDGVADYIDFKRKSNPADTLNVQMQDRICLQFCIKVRDMHLLPEIENAVLDFLNSNEALQQSYAVYLPNLQNEAAFNHSQAQKLDSLTSSYYFYNASAAQPMNYSGNGVNFYGDRRVRLFLDELYKQREHMQQFDYRVQLASAPVVLENHFAVQPAPVNGRRKMLALFFLLGWLGGCVIAEAVDKRKAVCAWFKA